VGRRRQEAKAQLRAFARTLERCDTTTHPDLVRLAQFVVLTRKTKRDENRSKNRSLRVQ
jgi:hypothetical protein